MKVTSLVISCSMLLSASFVVGAQGYLTYKCDIPKPLMLKLSLIQRDSSVVMPEISSVYRKHHEEGWKGMMAHYLKEGLSDYSPPLRQELSIRTNARKIGIAEARVALMKAELVMGRDKLVEFVKKEYPPKP